jgi:hypothetical protein
MSHFLAPSQELQANRWIQVERIRQRLQVTARVEFQDGVRWTRSRRSAGLMGQIMNSSGKWGTWATDWTGGHTQKRITGLTRDASGNPLGGCTVELYLTSTGALVNTVTSDSGGWYAIQTPYTGQHYVVAYKAGSPDRSGTTVNTLTGA